MWFLFGRLFMLIPQFYPPSLFAFFTEEENHHMKMKINFKGLCGWKENWNYKRICTLCVWVCLFVQGKVGIFLYDKRFLGLDRVKDDSTPLSSNSLEQFLRWNISERHGEVVKTFLWLLVCIRTYAQSFSLWMRVKPAEGMKEILTFLFGSWPSYYTL